MSAGAARGLRCDYGGWRGYGEHGTVDVPQCTKLATVRYRSGDEIPWGYRCPQHTGMLSGLCTVEALTPGGTP